MSWILNKKKTEIKAELDLTIINKEFGSDREKLLALLGQDFKLIDKERAMLKEALTALKKAKIVSKKHLNVIQKRLDLVHSRLLLVDKLAGEETALQPAEVTTLRSLSEKADKIVNLLK